MPETMTTTSQDPARTLAGLVGLTYAGISYVLFLASFTLFAVAVAGVWNPWGTAIGGSVALAALQNLGLVLLFAVQHTIMARAHFKQSWTRLIPAHLERSTFVLFSSLILFAIVYFWQPLPGHLWEVSSPAIRGILWGLFGLGYLGVVATSFLIDHFDLFGLKQSWLYFRGRSYSGPVFREPWAYRRVRHPMMVAILVMMWSTPSMSVSQAVMAGLFTLYILVGTIFEERELAQDLGDDYLAYQQRVPKLLPRLR